MDELVIDAQVLEEIAKQISPELRQEFQQLLSKLKKQPPGVTYDDQYRHLGPIQSIPYDLERCQSKLKLVVERYLWQSQICSYQEFLKRNADHRVKQLELEKSELLAQVDALRKDKLRLKNQLLTLMGIKDGAANDEDHQSDATADESHKDGKKEDEAGGKKRRPRGAPKGHRGNNRNRPDKVDNINLVAPPSCCPHCNHDEIRAVSF